MKSLINESPHDLTVGVSRDKYLIFLILFIGFMWAKSGYGKFVSGNFADNLGKTLTAFASKNPYPWYKDFLNNIAIPNSQLFGNLTLYGEMLSAVALIGGSIYLLTKGVNKLVLLGLMTALLGGMFLNLIFWFAAGWTSPATDSVNLLMFTVQLVGMVYCVRLVKTS